MAGAVNLTCDVMFSEFQAFGSCCQLRCDVSRVKAPLSNSSAMTTPYRAGCCSVWAKKTPSRSSMIKATYSSYRHQSVAPRTTKANFVRKNQQIACGSQKGNAYRPAGSRRWMNAYGSERALPSSLGCMMYPLRFTYP